MTSKRPYRFAKQWTGGHVDVQVFELFSCVNSFFSSDKFTYLLNSWMKTSYRSVVVPRLIPHIEMRQQNLSHNSTCRVPALSYTVKALISNEVSPSPKIHQIFQTFLFKVTDGGKLIFHWLLTIILNQSQIIEPALTTHSYFNNKKVARKENMWSPVILYSFMYNNLL